jgi:hypothetical protein
LETLIEKLLMEGEALLFELVNLRGLGFDNLEFTSQISDLEFEKTDVFESF